MELGPVVGRVLPPSSQLPLAPPRRGPLPRHVRDLLVLDWGRGRLLLVACDSAGGVGPQAMDEVHAAPAVVGRCTARVALMELLAAGGDPLAVALTVANEPGLAAETRAGVLAEMALLGLGEPHLVMSSEKNLRTVQTGVGVTALGFATRRSFLPGGARAGDELLVVGRPKVGPEVRGADDPEVADLPLVLAVQRSGLAHDMLPVGSRGVAAEARDLAASAGLGVAWREGVELDLRKSAGPATALVVALTPRRVSRLEPLLQGRPVWRVGWLLGLEGERQGPGPRRGPGGPQEASARC